jgi:hypothetical protein
MRYTKEISEYTSKLDLVGVDWLTAGRPRGQSSRLDTGQDFCPLHVFQTGSGAHPMGTAVKAAGAWKWLLIFN